MPGARRSLAARRPVRALVVLVLTIATVPAAATTLLKPGTLRELVEESRRAVRAKVVEVRYGFDEHRAHSTFVTLAIEDVLYGDVPPAGARMRIKLYGSPVALEDGTRLFVDGTPEYRVGERYLLLLLDDSRLGFTNTAGLFQGAFRIEGNHARSLGGDRSVFGDAGPVPYELLRAKIVSLHRDRRGDP